MSVPSADDRNKWSTLLAEALRLAAELHGAQRRKLCGTPYVGHLLRVAGLVLEYGGSFAEAAAALLHDAAEDQGGIETLEKIRQRFGAEVADLVFAVSDSFETPKPPWPERKNRFLVALRASSLPVRRIVLADKVDNLRSLLAAHNIFGEAVWEKFRGGKEGTLWYFGQIAEILSTEPADPLFRAGLTELFTLVAELKKRVGADAGGGNNPSCASRNEATQAPGKNLA